MWRYDSIKFREFNPIILMWTQYRINREKLYFLTREKNNMNREEDNSAIYIKLINMFKGTLMQIWKSANIFLFMWNQYVEDLTLRRLLIFEIYVGEICKKFFLRTSRNNTIYKKLAYFLRNLQTSRANNSQNLWTKKAKFSAYSFYMNTNI